MFLYSMASPLLGFVDGLGESHHLLGFAVFRGCPCAFPSLCFILARNASIKVSSTLYTLETLQFSRKRVALFLSMRFRDKVRLSGVSESTWARWLSGDSQPSIATLEQVADSLSNCDRQLSDLNPMEVLAGILIARSSRRQ